jgi:hypothetical protein
MRVAMISIDENKMLYTFNFMKTSKSCYLRDLTIMIF